LKKELSIHPSPGRLKSTLRDFLPSILFSSEIEILSTQLPLVEVFLHISVFFSKLKNISFPF